MNYAAIKKTDVANGPGIRVSLFVSGCTHACKGCFNSEAWDFAYGKPFTAETEREILQALSHAYIKGFSVLGGEPMEPENRGTVLGLLRKVRAAYPEKSIWCYTGYDYEKDLLRWAAEGDGTVRELLELTDVLVDGEFVEEKKNLRLAFRGSENQRLIDVRATKKAGHVVCLPE
ncbi:MAG: anaerobic ribonucleoside-triphosphate reductase activating protein [Lachnospiraceae bacterium]|nr:anaerobic ribonucleoside-triphosphate reductase activating protein [Lachnospiraceae bacterium]MCM1238207.1 anaerobic ribonucleoside-triphosphate reductase activating protein [Lachnospiraceae bacterium]